MAQPLQLQLTSALRLRLGSESIRLSVPEGLAFAESLIRASIRRAMVEEAARPEQRTISPSRKRKVAV